MKNRFLKRINSVVCVAAVLAVIASAARASDQTWIDPARDANWDDAGVWTGAGYPGAAGDIARFSANIPAGKRTVSLNGLSVSLGQLFIGDTNADGNYLLIPGLGGRLTFDAGLPGAPSFLWQGLGAATNQIGAPITLQNDLRTNLAAGTLYLTGVIDGPGQLVRNGTGSANPQLRDVLVLQNPANSFTGGIRISAGAVRATAAGALGSGTVTLNGNLRTDTFRAQLDLVNDASTSFGNSVVMASDGWITVQGATSAATGQVHSLGNLTHTQGATLYVDGTNGFGLQFGGVATLGGVAGFCVNTLGSDLTLAGPVVGPGATLLKSGNGVMVLTSAADANYTGRVAIRGGALELDGSAVLTGASSIEVFTGGTLALHNSDTNLGNRLADSSQVTMRGGTFQFTGADTATSSENAGALKLASGTSWFSTLSGFAGSSVLTFASTSRDTGAVANFSNFFGTLGTAANQIRLNADGSPVALTGGILGGWATVDNDWATYDANLGARPLPASAYLGGITDGNWNPAANVRPEGAVVLTANRTVNSVNLAGGGNIDANGFTQSFTLNIVTGGLLAAGGDRRITGGRLTAGGSGGGELFVTVEDGRTLTVTSALVDANNGGAPVTLVKSGPGTMVLGSPNSYSGGTYIDEGSIESNAVGQLGGGNITLAGGTLALRSAAAASFAKNLLVKDSIAELNVGAYGASGVAFTLGNLTMSGGPLSVSGSNSARVVFSGTTTLNGEAAFILGTPGTDLTLAGKVTGGGALSKSGDGVLYLAGTGDDFSGGWRLESGAMDANHAGAMGTGPGQIRGGALYARSASVLDSNAAVTVNSGGELHLYAAQNQNAGAVILAGGEMNLLNDSGTAFGLNVIIAPNSNDASAASIIQVNPATSGGALEQLHTIKTLDINNATVSVSSSPATGDSLEVAGTTTLNGNSTINLQYSCPAILNGSITGAGKLILTTVNPGVLTVNGSSSDYSGGTQLANSGATMTVTGTNALGTGDVTMVAGSTLNLNGINSMNSATQNVTNDALLHVGAGASSLVGDVVPSAALAGTVQLDAGSALSVHKVVQNAVSVGAAATLTLRGGSATTNVVNNLTIAGATNAWTGTVDTRQNYLVVNNGNLATMTNQIASGLNPNGNLWTGTGITSSVAASDGNGATALGIARASDLGLAGQPLTALIPDADPVTLSASSVIVRQTLFGDADMNGTVDADLDLTQWFAGFANYQNLAVDPNLFDPNITGWLYGDFNYDGVVDADLDLTQWFAGFAVSQNQAAAPGAPGAVPEPATLVLMGLGAVSLLRRGARKP